MSTIMGLWAYFDDLPAQCVILIALATLMIAMVIIRLLQRFIIELTKDRLQASAVIQWRAMAHDVQETINRLPPDSTVQDHFSVLSSHVDFSRFDRLFKVELEARPQYKVDFNTYTHLIHAGSPRSPVVDNLIKRIEWMESLWGLDRDMSFSQRQSSL